MVLQKNQQLTRIGSLSTTVTRLPVTPPSRAMGGLQDARVFKISGARRLLRTQGPAAALAKKGAVDLIGQNDSDNPNAKFSDHLNLHIEQRPHGTNLQPEDVFGRLVEEGLFRSGAELNCTSCRMNSWIALDALKQSVVCELCGHEYEATRQLMSGVWHYRRSGVLGGNAMRKVLFRSR